ncbi:MAG: hypothetical protein AAF436_19010 [Myxococcota bacterium]
MNDAASEKDLRDAGEHIYEDGDPRDEDDEARARREARQAKREAGERNRARLRGEAQAAITRANPSGPQGTGGARRSRASSDERIDRSPLVGRKLPDPKFQLADVLGKSAGGRAWTELTTAADHLEAGRAGAARPIAQSLYRKAPEVLEVAEVWGLTLYNLGKWREAIDVLEDVRELSGLPDTNPVLADAHRAVGNHADVQWLWNELREASPAAETMTEGRIVAAGSLADQGDLQGAVRLLEKGWKRPKRPFEHHLRRAYALADLYERAGERPRAKELFAWVAHHDRGYVDAAERAQ